MAATTRPEPRRGAGPEGGLDGTLGFMRALWAVDHGLRKSSLRMHRSLGVGGRDRLAIRIIGRFSEISAGELAKILHVHPSTLTGVLDRLLRAGLLRRSADPEDARRARFELTPAGRRIDRIRSDTVEDRVARALRTLPQPKIDAALQVLERVAEELVARPQRATRRARQPSG